ncbi:MAG: uroporphyrinogen-III synthase [Actinomycetota bacterium]|nr:uroporphyrinogen-III synthase [Actinomycetota bacterium]
MVVTAARDTSAALVSALGAASATVIDLPMIAVGDPPDGGRALANALARLDGYEWVVFTSANAARRVFRLVGSVPSSLKIAVVGPSTAAVVEAGGASVDLVAPGATAASLVAGFPEQADGGNGRVLFPCAEVARDEVAPGLRNLGWDVDVVVAYATLAVVPAPGHLARAAGADAVIFASPSAVRALLAAAPEKVPPAVVCIGPTTAQAAIDAGLEVAAIASDRTAQGIVATLVDLFATGRA